MAKHIKSCPMCLNDQVELVETEHKEYFGSEDNDPGVAVECLWCGCRGMACENDDMAIDAWNTMEDAGQSEERQ